MHKPLISVITVCLNSEEFIEHCIQSVISQEFSDFEYIIIDGGSTDKTIDIIKNNESGIDYWESKPDRGIYHAWNKALLHVKGEWIYFLGADDYFWDEYVLEKIARYLESSSLNVVYGKVNVVNNTGKILGTYGEPWTKIRKTFKELMVLPHQGVFHNIQLFKKYGLFDEQFRISGDYEFLLRDLKTNNALYIDDLIVAGKRHGGLSSNAASKLQTLSEISLASKKNKVDGLRLKWRWTYGKAYVRCLLSRVLGESITSRIVNYYRLLTNRIPIE